MTELSLFPSPLAGEGSGDLVNAVTPGSIEPGGGRGVVRYAHASPEATRGEGYLPHRALHHPPSLPSPARGEGAHRACREIASSLPHPRITLALRLLPAAGCLQRLGHFR